MVVFFSVFFFVSHVRICMRAACCCAGSFPVWSGGRTEQGEINIAAELQTGIFCKVSWLEDNEGGKLDYPGRWTYSRDVIIDRKNECQIFSTLKNTHAKKKKEPLSEIEIPAFCKSDTEWGNSQTCSNKRSLDSKRPASPLACFQPNAASFWYFSVSPLVLFYKGQTWAD